MAIGNRQVVWRPNAKFYIFLGVVAAIVIAILFLVFNIKTEEISTGEIVYEIKTPGIIVRDEQVISAENYGRANFRVQEGDRVEAGSVVTEVYNWGYNEQVMNNLLEAQTNSQKYQENELYKDVQDEQLLSLGNQISEKAAEINDIVQGQTKGDLVQTERTLKSLMDQKRQYLKEAVNPDQTLNDFLNKEQQLQNRIDAWKQEVTAPSAGVVSFYMDGKENLLNANNIQRLTSADLAEIFDGTGGLSQETAQAAVQETVQTPLFRLVNNFKWYVLVRSEAPIREFANGNQFTIAFDDYMDKQYTGTVVGSITEPKINIYVVEITEDIGQLLTARRTDTNFYTKFQGLRVPENAIAQKDGEQGVTLVEGGKRAFVPVNVKTIKNGFAIIESADPQTPLSSGQNVEVKGL